MDEVVAVKHINPVPGRIVGLDLDRLPLIQPDDILQPLRFVVVHWSVLAV